MVIPIEINAIDDEGALSTAQYFPELYEGVPFKGQIEVQDSDSILYVDDISIDQTHWDCHHNY